MSETATPDNELLADLEEAMRDVVDPELGINVVDLGLLYGIDVHTEDTGTVATLPGDFGATYETLPGRLR